jgi:putative copper export protein
MIVRCVLVAVAVWIGCMVLLLAGMHGLRQGRRHHEDDMARAAVARYARTLTDDDEARAAARRILERSPQFRRGVWVDP